MKGTAANPTKFTFDTVFSAGESVMSEDARGRQKKVMTTADIERLKNESFAQGTRAGETQALEGIAAEVAGVSDAIREILNQSAGEIENVRAEAVEIAFAMARKLAGHALAAAPMSEVEASLREAMHQALGEPRLTVRANPKVVDALQPDFDRIAHEEGFEGRVLLIADPHFTSADCRMEWRGGGAERTQANIESALAELIERRFSSHTSKE